jgi:NADH:ubiquinone oxidoreductase subunit 4 (subunit M)
LIASIAIAMAAYYALRLFQQAMHNRKREEVESREIGWPEGIVVGALVACIVALAIYPGLILGRSDDAVSAQLTEVSQPQGAEIARR